MDSMIGIEIDRTPEQLEHGLSFLRERWEENWCNRVFVTQSEDGPVRGRRG